MTNEITNTLVLAIFIALGVILVAGLVVISQVQQSVLADKGGVPNTHASSKARRHCTVCE